MRKAPLKTINSNERIQSPCSLDYIPLIRDTYYCWLYLMDWIPTPHPSGVSKHGNLQMQCVISTLAAPEPLSMADVSAGDSVAQCETGGATFELCMR